jgi:UMF1 family MFS transporter
VHNKGRPATPDDLGGARRLDLSPPAGRGGTRTASRRAIVSWLFFDWAAQPVFTLLSTFVFAPYFATAVVGDPVRGQALWGYATAAAGFGLGLLSPILGSIADAAGARKPWIAGAGAVLVVACASLWFATPAASATLIFWTLAAYAAGLAATEVATVFSNAMMPHLVSPERLGRLSGAGWAIGYLGGLLSLVLVLGFLAGLPETGRTYLGLKPLFGLDPAMREGDRIAGPLAAVWFLVFVLPLFLFTPDRPSTGKRWRQAAREGLARLKSSVAEARADGRMARFLIANMIYQDGLVALFAFGGIYGAGVLGWGPVELGVFGILLTVTGTAGAFVGGYLDDRLGSKRIVLGAIAILIVLCAGMLSLGRDYVVFVVPTDPPRPGDGLFAAASEKLFLGIGLVIGAVAGPLQASSRSLLARMAPVGESGRYFGLFALSGRLTSFAAPLLVALATAASGSQAAGLAVLVAFFAVGGWLLRGVHLSRETGEVESAKPTG